MAPFGNQEAIGGNAQGSVMMKAAPAAPFKVPQPEFLLQFLVIALNNPAVFGEIDQIAERCVGGKRGQPVLRRLLFLLWPFDQKPFFRMRLGAPVIAVSGPYTKSGEAGYEFVFHALSPRDIRPCLRGQRQGEFFCAERLMFRVSSQKSGWPPQAFSLWRGLRLLARSPHAYRALYADNIRQLPFGKPGPKLRFGAVARVSQHNTCRHASFPRPPDLLQRDPGLGLEDNFLRYACLFPPPFVTGPHFRKIQAERDRHAGVLCRDRKTHRYPAVILLAYLTAILARDPDRMLSLLWKARVIHYPRHDRPLSQHGRKHCVQCAVEENLVIPGSIRHQMVQRLMHPAHMIRIQPRRHGLNALAFSRQKQSRAVRLEGNDSICMAGRLRQAVEVLREPFLLCAWRPRCCGAHNKSTISCFMTQ